MKRGISKMWNLADVFDAVADAIPDSPALIHGASTLSWGELNQNANNLARFIEKIASKRQICVAQYLFNSNEYIESLIAIFKAGLRPVNTNYRYVDDELIYLFDNSEAEIVIFHGSFVDRIESIKDRLQTVKTWIYVDDGTLPKPDFALDYAQIISEPFDTENYYPNWGRQGDDLYLLYTGGTTGMPKGVMWRQDDLFCLLNSSNLVQWPEDSGPDYIRENLKTNGTVHLPACPLMHGTGAFTSFAALFAGGCVVTLEKRNFDPIELLDTIDRHGVQTLAIVGDAFAKPILKTLDEFPGRWSLSSLIAILSSGVMWSEATKEGLLRHKPSLLLADLFSSSEALGIGTSISTGNAATHTASFRLGENATVLGDDNTVIEPGSKKIGRLALRGRTPIGYLGDEEKSKQTFPVVNGIRYSIPGDYASVEEDGPIQILGRGSVCINTGGEKVFPEEVEEVLKTFPQVLDAIVVGVPDDRFGEIVRAAVVTDNGVQLNKENIQQFMRSHLAAYKIPKTVLFVDSARRSPSGKLDYSYWKDVMSSINND